MNTASFPLDVWLSALPLLLAAATCTWLVSLALRNVTLADPLWPLMLFVAGVVYALGSDPRGPRLSPVLWLLAAWAARLAFALTLRHAGAGETRTYRDLRARHEPNFALKSLVLVFWLRALAAWVVSLPLLGAFTTLTPLGALDTAAALVWLAGFGIEITADWQLARFRRDPANADRVLDTGLWRFCRHPNYFGEALVWCGFLLFALAAGAWWAFAGPALLLFLLVRSRTRAQESSMLGRRPAYADYARKTPGFLPSRPGRHTRG